MRVVVVGAGAIGAAVTHQLTQRGVETVLIDRDGAARGTSAATFSVSVTTRKTPRSFFDLNVEALARHKELSAQFDGTTWCHPTTIHEWGVKESDVAVIGQRVDRLRDWGYSVSLISPADFAAVEPNVAVPEGIEAIVQYPDEAWYDAPTMVLTLLAAAQQCGAELVLHDEVASIDTSVADEVTVTTASGQKYRGDRLVVCAGASTDEVLARAGLTLALNHVPGLIGTATTTRPLLNGVLILPEVDVRPGPRGRVVLHSFPVDGLIEADSDDIGSRAAKELLDRATDALKDSCGLSLEYARIGIRPVPPDGLPAIGPHEAAPQVYIAVSHSAIHLAPVLGRKIAAEIADGIPDAALADFRPSRFSDTDSEPTYALDESFREMMKKLNATDPA